MKTTLDLPDPIFRKAKATAAGRGQSLKKGNKGDATV